MRVILIGQAPGPNTKPEAPLYPYPATSAGGRLASFLGLSLREYLERFERYNVLNHFPGQGGSGEDRFPKSEARCAAQAMWPFLRGRRVVFVGRQVAEAFGFGAVPFLESVEALNRKIGEPGTSTADHKTTFVVIPHPSGRNPWYSRPENREALRTYFDGVFNLGKVPEELLGQTPTADSACLLSADVYDSGHGESILEAERS